MKKKLKEKKKLQNAAYKEMLKKMRQSYDELNEICKIRQKLWKQKSRKKQKELNGQYDQFSN